MNDPADDIRRQMRSIRRDMGADVQGIVHSAQQLSDWRYYVRKFPWLSVGSAFALGLLAAPKRRRLGQNVDVEKILAQIRQGNLPNLPGSQSWARGLLVKALAVAGPIAVRSVTSMLAAHFSGPRQGGEEEHGQSFQQVSKPR